MYRTIELSQGYLGKLATTESLFYGLDTLPLFIAFVIYTPFWPGRYISLSPNVPRNSEKVGIVFTNTTEGSLADSKRRPTDDMAGGTI